MIGLLFAGYHLSCGVDTHAAELFTAAALALCVHLEGTVTHDSDRLDTDPSAATNR